MRDHLFHFSKEEERIRLLVLKESIIVETLLSNLLKCLLNIKGSSKSFGNSSSSLSFSQKANILIDTNFLNPEDANKFKTFMEIRNQFMHNAEAKNFDKCLSFINGKEKYLFKTYPDIKSINKEDKLEQIWISLFEDIILVITKILNDFKANKHVHFYLPNEILAKDKNL